jgi:membrane associated rhomboid family serine protease
MNEQPRTWRDVYRRNPHVWNGLAIFGIAVVLIASWLIYELCFAPLGSKPIVNGYVVGKAIGGALLAWVLIAIVQKKSASR